MTPQLRALTRKLKVRLLLLLGLVLILLLSLLAADVIPPRRGSFAGTPLGRTILIVGVVMILLLCLSSLDLSSRIRALVIREDLTGLFDRDFALLRLKEECYRSQRYRRPLSLILIELQNFRAMNLHYGHSSGEHFLRYFGNIIGQAIRPSDIAARFDDQKFLIILPETAKKEARNVAHRLKQEVLLHPFRIEPESDAVNFAFSAGVSSFPDDAATAEGLIDHAVSSLAEAKGDDESSV